ncbi:MAG TPA: hypothetical protein PLX88_09980 [Syntrophorhabdaceae bacterium]|jgi:hypothetical protein|nr:hypothetical protein [Syntrophorhabdaceae bacterium]MDI9561245.1 hypothetical protein [Pseudomonadota bacterium]MBP8697433.1 hypothetical protein [Syntrophorhabdaceae bacterium]HOS58930.1 hypothetical protein [Syntrophorhabdaceae bacterium]HPH41525.1 hypothetical protein [Syntrophorhabdaceae bacterium]
MKRVLWRKSFLDLKKRRVRRSEERQRVGGLAEDRRQKTEVRSQKSEGWRVGRLAKKSEEEKGLWVPNQRNKRNQLEV